MYKKICWGLSFFCLFVLFSRTALAADKKINTPPIAKFKVEKQYVFQGEKINYIDESYDSDGDQIVERKWTGKLPFFFQTGTHLVTLQVKDSQGAWSEPVEMKITVWRKVKVPAFYRQVSTAKIGEIIDLTNEETLCYKPLEGIVNDWGPTLLLSNSPENVLEKGILYADDALGSIRLYYYHKNSSSRKKKIYILAENKGEETANINIYRQGQAGPSNNELILGKNGLFSYFSTPKEDVIVVQPRQTVILNSLAAKKSLAPGQIAHEIMDIYSDKSLRFTYLAVEEEDDPLSYYAGDIPILAKDNHPRGTFLNANRYLQITVASKDKQRILLADNSHDKFLQGKDALLGEETINHGNYGVLYAVSIASPYKIGLVTEARGGPFAGAVVNTDNKVYMIPEKGIMRAFTEGTLNGFFSPSETYSEKMMLMIPVGSSTPLDLLVAPLDDKQ